MADRQLVLAFFPDEAAADSAADALKDSGSPTATPSGSWRSIPTASSRRTRSAHEHRQGRRYRGRPLPARAGDPGGRRHRRHSGRCPPSQEPGPLRCRQGAPHRGPERGQGGGRCDGPQRHCACDLRQTGPARRHARSPRTHRRSPADCWSDHLGSLTNKAAWDLRATAIHDSILCVVAASSPTRCRLRLKGAAATPSISRPPNERNRRIGGQSSPLSMAREFRACEARCVPARLRIRQRGQAPGARPR